MEHKKAGGSTSLGRDSKSKRLGVKINHGQYVKPGQVIIRQRGTKYYPADNVKKGGDDTLLSKIAGTVKFYKRKARRFDGNLKLRNFVAVEPITTKKTTTNKVKKVETPKTVKKVVKKTIKKTVKKITKKAPVKKTVKKA